jgi:predicted ATP-grasp superfamily ATP-dependent carboligase
VSSLYELVERPELDAPVLVLALDGWIDAGLGGANARTALVEALDLVTVAVFDADELLDHRARRPVMHLVDGVNTGLTWPSIELQAASDEDGNDILLLAGAEPDHLWGQFSRSVVDLAMEFGSRLVVGLGAYPAPVPHTRPTRLAAAATVAELVERVGEVRASIDVPSGVHAAIERRAGDLGVPAIGLWAQVPHYAAAMPFPAASAALVDGLCEVAGLVLDSASLHEEAVAMRSRLDALIADNDEHVAMVRQLEAQVDASSGSTLGPLPSGDELAAELERFLRDQGS